LRGRKYDLHHIISKRILARKQVPYEHEHVEGFDNLSNLETCVDMEVTLQHDQTKHIETTSQEGPTQKPSPRLVFKDPKMSIYNKRSSS
jgi:hypothetical protein